MLGDRHGRGYASHRAHCGRSRGPIDPRLSASYRLQRTRCWVRVWLLLALLATILWDWATIVTYLVLKPYLSESAAEAARDAAQGVRIFTWTLDFVLIGFMAYMELLRWLIKLLAESESKDKS